VRGSDSATFNLAYALDFTDAPRTDVPAITVAQGPFGGLCSGAAAPASSSSVSSVDNSQLTVNPTADRFADLRAKAASLGFKTGP
jgi:phospholipase C